MIPKFSDDPVQNAEMTAEYLWDCRIAGENPFGGGSYDDDPDDYDDYDDYDDEDEE